MDRLKHFLILSFTDKKEYVEWIITVKKLRLEMKG